MNNKKVKKLISCICASSLLLGAVPSNGIEASATDATANVENGVTFSDTAGNQLNDAEYSLHGVTYDADEGVFVRMDLEEAAKIAGTDSVYKNGEWALSVYSLVRESSGGRIRFNTNSPTITIEAELYLHDLEHYKHGMKMEAAKYGFDVYVDTSDGSTIAGTVQGDAPELLRDEEDSDEDGNTTEATGIASNMVSVNQTITLGETQERDITIYFPLMIETKSVKISVAEGSTVQEHKNSYEGNGRVVFYGNSITQGGSAVKPGSNYVNTTMRNLNMDFTNLGVWGSCKGQATFAEYIANLDNVSMLVMDYDGNESQASVLEARHYPFYEKVREKYPNIPIVLLTRSGNRLQVRNAEDSRYSTTAELREVIRQTYEKAKADGDENIHYLDGETFFGFSYAYLADGVHPTSTGQQKMADVLTVVLKEVLAGAKNLCVEPSPCKDPTTVLTKDFTGEENGTVQPDGWKASSQKTLSDSLECYVTTNEDDNQAYQMKFTKGTGGAMVTLTPGNTVWNGEMNLAVEMDVELHVTDGVIPQLGVKIGETPNNAANQKYEVRMKVTDENYTVSFYDGTGGVSNPSEPVHTATSVADQNFIKMYEEGKVAFNLKITQTQVRYDDVDTLELNVYINDMLVGGYNLNPQEGYEPNSFKIFCYGAGTNGVGVNKAVVDNINAYVTTTHQLNRMATEGIREHYVCSECGKNFLDEIGVITYDCINTPFEDDFENLEESEETWEENRSNYATDGEEGEFGIIEENGNHVYQLLTTRGEKFVNNHIYVKDSILKGHQNYTVSFKGVMYQSGGAWPAMSVRLRNSGAKGYEVRMQPTEDGYKIDVIDRTGDTVVQDDIIIDKDGNLATQMVAGKVSFTMRVEVKRVIAENNTEKVTFTTYIDDNEPSVKTITLQDPTIKITRAFLYLSSGTADGVTYKGTFDDVRIYTESHTLNLVAAVPSTDDVAGTREHYACEVCLNKFADSKGEQAVTDAQLTYAKLTDILCQTKANATNSQNEDIRFLVYIDDYRKYQSVTFKITCSAGTGTAICKNAYTGVYAGGQLYTTEDVFGIDGYFATFILGNNTPANLEDTMTVVATWKALDGTETKTTRVVNISEERK